MPKSDQVPLEMYGSPSSTGAASTALAVSCEAQNTTSASPPTSAATSGSSLPAAAPGCTVSPNRCSGRPSAAQSSLSKARVSALTRPVVVALVYSCALTPVSLYVSQAGIIKKSVTPSSLPAHLSAYSW